MKTRLPRKKRRSVLTEEADTDDEFQEKDDDFDMNAWSMTAQPETGTLG